MGKLTVKETGIDGVYEVTTDAFKDHRGIFARWFCDKELNAVLDGRRIVNVNFSYTRHKGSVRGMHFQRPPDAEMKMVRCIRGRVLDVAVDIRKGSPTFLKHVAVELSSEKMNMLVIPEGFAHGFQSLEDDCEIMYLVTTGYSSASESGLNPCDPAIGIKWPLNIEDISDKDRDRPLLSDSYEGVDVSRL